MTKNIGDNCMKKKTNLVSSEIQSVRVRVSVSLNRLAHSSSVPFGIAVAVALIVALGGVTVVAGQPATAADAAASGKNGRFFFDKETFGGNGRTCLTCHSKETGTVSIQEAQARFAKDRNDSLFRSPDSDNLDGQSFDRLLTTGTIKIDVPLAPKVRLVDNPSARTATVFRGTPTTRNSPTLQQFLMSDG